MSGGPRERMLDINPSVLLRNRSLDGRAQPDGLNPNHLVRQVELTACAGARLPARPGLRAPLHAADLFSLLTK